VDSTWNRGLIELSRRPSFTTNLGNMRITYNFTPYIFTQSLIQYTT